MSDRFSYIMALLAVAAVAFSWYITPWTPAEADAGLPSDVPVAEAPAQQPETSPSTAPAAAPATKTLEEPTHSIDPRCPHTGSDKT